ncbi:Hpt domain-containing protein [Paenirhodobacter populi]|uniref:Hpt domain-containing protein n=1 Tax=Paenirhodobacter populi TaxID=2306993 RepID=UPI000FE3A2DA|nr:Hpt domain-containing protein [Sinirhodobacter populi]RWR04767.1 Hpt domain-containing protein [Sinirhodobacter populi]
MRNLGRAQSPAGNERWNGMLIDWKMVEDLHADIGTADFAEVVMLFLSEVEDVLNPITPGPLSSEELHFLKGSALNLGFVGLAGLCRDADAPDARMRRAMLQDTFVQSRNEFLARVGHYLRAVPAQEPVRSGIPPGFHLP